MKKQTIALLASGLLLASGMSFAQDNTAAGTSGNTAAGATGGLSTPAGVGLVVVAGGLAYAAASDGSGSGSSTSTSTATQTGNGFSRQRLIRKPPETMSSGGFFYDNQNRRMPPMTRFPLVALGVSTLLLQACVLAPGMHMDTDRLVSQDSAENSMVEMVQIT